MTTTSGTPTRIMKRRTRITTSLAAHPYCHDERRRGIPLKAWSPTSLIPTSIHLTMVLQVVPLRLKTRQCRSLQRALTAKNSHRNGSLSDLPWLQLLRSNSEIAYHFFHQSTTDPQSIYPMLFSNNVPPFSAGDMAAKVNSKFDKGTLLNLIVKSDSIHLATQYSSVGIDMLVEAGDDSLRSSAKCACFRPGVPVVLAA